MFKVYVENYSSVFCADEFKTLESASIYLEYAVPVKYPDNDAAWIEECNEALEAFQRDFLNGLN